MVSRSIKQLFKTLGKQYVRYKKINKVKKKKEVRKTSMQDFEPKN